MVNFLKKFGVIGLLLVSSVGVSAAEEGLRAALEEPAQPVALVLAQRLPWACWAWR